MAGCAGTGSGRLLAVRNPRANWRAFYPLDVGNARKMLAVGQALTKPVTAAATGPDGL
jgi:hypothetical protein